MRMADLFLLTCCPPAPCARMVSILRSASLMWMSTSSTSGSTATVAAELDAAGSFGVRHSLHAMHARFEFELGEYAAAAYFGDDFLEATFAAFAQRKISISSPGLRRNVRTYGRGRRQTARLRHRRCRRGFPGSRCDRPSRPWASKPGAFFCPASSAFLQFTRSLSASLRISGSLAAIVDERGEISDLLVGGAVGFDHFDDGQSSANSRDSLT